MRFFGLLHRALHAPWLIVALLALLLAAHAGHYYPFLSDDALISLRYSERWADGHGLTWTDGERVEGYTDLLWVLLVGIAGWFGADYVWAARVLGFLGVLAAAIVVGLDPRTKKLERERLLSGGLFLVASPPLAVWAIGGLEHGCMAGVLALAIFRLNRAKLSDARGERWQSLVDGLPLAALSLLRADGAVLVAGALAGACFLPRFAKDSLLRCVWRGLPVLAALGGQLAFRYAYYGALTPNTAAAKLAFNGHRLLQGLEFVGRGYLALAVVVTIAVLLTVALYRAGALRAVAVAWATLLTWTAYQVAVGGDIFPGWRQHVFIVVALCAVIAEGTATQGALGVRRLLPLVGLAGLNFGVGLFDAENVRAKRELWEWDGLSVGTALNRAFAKMKPLLAVDAAGALPYWSKLACIDMLGLNDRYLATHPPPDFGKGQIGHELGNGAYVFSREPDLMAFSGAAGTWAPIFRSPRELFAMPEFHRRYQPIALQGDAGNRALGQIYVRREGGKLGVVRDTNRIEIPGYFFTGPVSGAVARLDAQDRVFAAIGSDRPGVLPPLEVPAGRYRLRFEPERADLVAALRCGWVTAERVGVGEPVIDLAETTAISAALATEQHDYALTRAIFESSPESVPTVRCLPAGSRAIATLADLSTPKREGANFGHPRNLVFDKAGASIRLPPGPRPNALEISVDNNDTYAVDGYFRGEVVYRAQLIPRQNGGGLAVHYLALQPAEAPAGLDELIITPTAGDSIFSIGHVALER